MNRNDQPLRSAAFPATTPRRPERSGAVAAALSFLFPGLGQAYLRRRSALIFAIPMLVVVVGLLIAFSGRGAAFRAADPTIAFWLIMLALVVGIWWIVAVVDAWFGGRHSGRPALAVAVLLVLAIGSGSAFASAQLWRVRNAVLDMTSVSGDPTLVEVTPSPTSNATQTATPSGSPGPSPTLPPDWVDPSDEPSDEPSPSIEPGPTPSVDITRIDAHGDGLLNVLIAGTDQGLPGHLGARTDTLVVVSVDLTTGDVLMFSWPRDLQGFPIYNGGTYNGKINTFAGVTKLYPDQFPEPGLRSLAYEVGFLLGVPIDYYASVNVDGFMAVVDAIGGSVTVCNEREIADDHLQFYLTPGLHQLNAADALRYARSRHGQSGGDFARAKRQQELLVAIKKEILLPQNLARLPDVIEALAGVVNTNFPPDQIQGLIDVAQQVQEEPSQTWVFKNPQWADFMTRAETGGRQVLTPRMDRIAQLSVFLFGDKSLYYGQVPMPSPGELPGPDSTSEPDASASPGVCAAQP